MQTWFSSWVACQGCPEEEPLFGSDDEFGNRALQTTFLVSSQIFEDFIERVNNEIIVLAEEGEVEAGFVQITIAYAQDNEEDPKETYIITDVPEEQMEQLYEMLPPAHPQYPANPAQLPVYPSPAKTASPSQLSEPPPSDQSKAATSSNLSGDQQANSNRSETINDPLGDSGLPPTGTSSQGDPTSQTQITSDPDNPAGTPSSPTSVSGLPPSNPLSPSNPASPAQVSSDARWKLIVMTVLKVKRKLDPADKSKFSAPGRDKAAGLLDNPRLQRLCEKGKPMVIGSRCDK